MFYKGWAILFCLFLSAHVQSKATLTSVESDRQPFSLDNASRDELIKYRKVIMHALINTADVCNTFDILPIAEFNDVEIANYLRSLVQRLTDREINIAIEEAVQENCSQKTQSGQRQQQFQQQHQMKREYVVLGKKQRFHAWGGKRADNLHNEPASLYFI